MLNFVENLLENERGPMNDQGQTKTDYDPDRSLVLIEGLSHFLTNFLQNLASCQTSLKLQVTPRTKVVFPYLVCAVEDDLTGYCRLSLTRSALESAWRRCFWK
jgi:hypothetical protein